MKPLMKVTNNMIEHNMLGNLHLEKEIEHDPDMNDKPRHVHSSLNVKKIIFTRMVKSNQYPDIVVPHKTIVRVVE